MSLSSSSVTQQPQKWFQLSDQLRTAALAADRDNPSRTVANVDWQAVLAQTVGSVWAGQPEAASLNPSATLLELFSDPVRGAVHFQRLASAGRVFYAFPAHIRLGREAASVGILHAFGQPPSVIASTPNGSETTVARLDMQSLRQNRYEAVGLQVRVEKAGIERGEPYVIVSANALGELVLCLDRGGLLTRENIEIPDHSHGGPVNPGKALGVIHNSFTGGVPDEALLILQPTAAAGPSSSRGPGFTVALQHRIPLPAGESACDWVLTERGDQVLFLRDGKLSVYDLVQGKFVAKDIALSGNRETFRNIDSGSLVSFISGKETYLAVSGVGFVQEHIVAAYRLDLANRAVEQTWKKTFEATPQVRVAPVIGGPVLAVYSAQNDQAGLVTLIQATTGTEIRTVPLQDHLTGSYIVGLEKWQQRREEVDARLLGGPVEGDGSEADEVEPLEVPPVSVVEFSMALQEAMVGRAVEVPLNFTQPKRLVAVDTDAHGQPMFVFQTADGHVATVTLGDRPSQSGEFIGANIQQTLQMVFMSNQWNALVASLAAQQKKLVAEGGEPLPYEQIEKALLAGLVQSIQYSGAVQAARRLPSIPVVGEPAVALLELGDLLQDDEAAQNVLTQALTSGVDEGDLSELQQAAALAAKRLADAFIDRVPALPGKLSEMAGITVAQTAAPYLDPVLQWLGQPTTEQYLAARAAAIAGDEARAGAAAEPNGTMLMEDAEEVSSGDVELILRETTGDERSQAAAGAPALESQRGALLTAQIRGSALWQRFVKPNLEQALGYATSIPASEIDVTLISLSGSASDAVGAGGSANEQRTLIAAGAEVGSALLGLAGASDGTDNAAAYASARDALGRVATGDEYREVRQQATAFVQAQAAAALDSDAAQRTLATASQYVGRLSAWWRGGNDDSSIT